MTEKILFLCEDCVSGYHCANNGCEREAGTWMGVDISDPRLRPERGRLLVIENGQEVEIKKVTK